jgi:hypothetical protein
MQADVVDRPALDLRQHLGHAVDEGLDADEAEPGMGRRLAHEMLAAAEADLQHIAVARPRKGRRGAGPRGIDAQARQQSSIEQIRLEGLRALPLRRPKKVPCPARRLSSVMG